ncbi:hypothetical protein kac65v162_gp128 [Nodularia phage vB_NspS-kac65v162]|jgi:hypothetical protein|uniref:Uncharacterized protein n=3 Tax=Ravarandavirus kac65v151 TaxID=2845689 RepID=A0A482MIH5_9CAUD|nr:hypothetical protein HWC12_gp189 [Nodularia phage vB_NspS-kac65v151]QBQ73158.1 hypothetical protein kac65v151_gp128 [Nodularia phage vB_NspS-kac65v151]QBQ73366.1 hypothetical protein kac65v161_gp128 [Nodularia phage vB_NspS-kac65v161]QBQ73572.1 hypothetical protein kac65v162_gp128 [Nodularia phage vB_NspS-kac65v162]
MEPEVIVDYYHHDQYLVIEKIDNGYYFTIEGSRCKEPFKSASEAEIAAQMTIEHDLENEDIE